MTTQYNRTLIDLGNDLIDIRFEIDKFICQPPHRDLVADIKANGIIEPVIACETDTGDWQVMSGQRRIIAATLTGQGVPVVLYKEIDPNDHLAWVHILNTVGEENPIHSLHAIKEMVEEGKTLETIRKAMYMTKKQVENLLMLDDLPQVVKDAVSDGTCTVNTARDLSKKPKSSWHLAVDELNDKGKLTGTFVRNMSRVARQKTVASLFADRELPGTHVKVDDTLYAIFDGQSFVTFAVGFEEGRSAAMMIDNADLYKMIPVEVK